MKIRLREVFSQPGGIFNPSWDKNAGILGTIGKGIGKMLKPVTVGAKRYARKNPLKAAGIVAAGAGGLGLAAGMPSGRAFGKFETTYKAGDRIIRGGSL